MLVQDLETGEQGFVLKRLKNVKRHARFDREIEALRRVDSPHVPKVLDVGEHDGRPFLVTRYAGNVLTKATLPGSVTNRLKLFRQAVLAISAAHQVRFVHRDIKPDNIVLDNDGVVGVVDFGICTDEGQGAVVLTTTVEGFGNRSFAAPECEPGSVDKASTPSDIYSLGKLLFWLVSNGKLVVRENFDTSALVVADQHERNYLTYLLRHTIVERPESRWATDELLGQIDWVLAKLDEHARHAPYVALVDTFGPDREFYRNGSRSATTPPHGNPPSRNEVAQRFTVGSSDFVLGHIDVALRRFAGDGKFQLQLVEDDDGRPQGAPLATWNEQLDTADYVVLSLRPSVEVQLSANQSYWLALSTPSPGSNIAWWSGNQNLRFLRTMIAERTDNEPWRSTDASGPGHALIVVAQRVPM